MSDLSDTHNTSAWRIHTHRDTNFFTSSRNRKCYLNNYTFAGEIFSESALWVSSTHTFANNPSQVLLLKFSVCSSCWFDRKWWSLFFKVEEVRFLLLLARFLFLFLICSVIAGRQRKGTSLTSSLMGKKERDEKGI